jgi:carbon-monoxide dehydrogenase iron sulfur subunit
MRGPLGVDPDKCCGCRLCQLSCSLRHAGLFDLKRARIRIVERERRQFVPKICLFCENPPCARACPTKALEPRPAGGVWVIEENCIGCLKCNEVCVNRVIRIPEEPIGPLVCDLCGGDPDCVKICPTQALSLEN